ncbi:MAG TPA: AAA family ATPase [Burkholderiales bacterium]|nr:AAA family ATPase [Burkholderiales bacterium]
MQFDMKVWLGSLGLAQYAELFAVNAIDAEVLADLTDDELRQLGVPLGHRKKLLKAIASLDGAAAPDTDPAPTTKPPAGERRQLTVLFCDMVGFTELANRVDPEVLQRIIRSYEDACAVCIARYEGYVFQRLGDAIVAFFGYPLAHEGEAERAIRAALEIIESLAKLDVPDAGHLAVRIGIATGLVVVSSVEKGAVGETMNLASRLQGIARPGSIVVSERVHHLAGGSFDYEDLGEQTLKGIARPTHAYRIVQVSEAASRFEAAHGEAGLTPLVGREQEIGLLLERWQLSQEGEGQIVMLSGEPGIGKSRVLSALRERLEHRHVQFLLFQCSPYYINSAFWPSIDNLERTLKFARDEPPESKLDKLEALVVAHYGRPLSDVRFIASMLSIPCDERYGTISMTPQKHKDETLRTLADLTEAAARNQPIVMLFEDLHWADPTTLELLDVLIQRLRSIPLLMLLTHRPEFQSRWSGQANVSALNLSKLTRAQTAAIVARLVGVKDLPAALLEQILAHTDGVPLFVEELTKSILESGELKEAGDHYEYVGSSDSITIPATLRDSLMARLDRLLPAKEIAQIGAAIGREFSYELIAAVVPHPKTDLDSALNQLTESGLAFRRGTLPESTYTFKHALVRDAAYDSLLKSKRRELHVQIATAIRERFSEQAEAAPELLAHHYTEGQSFESAAHYWRVAAERAAVRFSTPEAIAHARQGLAIVAKLPESEARTDQELALRICLISSLRIADRLGEALEQLDQAEALAAKNGRNVDLARIHHLRGNIYFPLGKMDQCLAEHQKSLEFARKAGSTEDEARTEGGLCDAYYMRGQLRSSHEHVERCIELCRAHGFDAIETAYLPMRATTHQYALRFKEALEDCRSVLDMEDRVSQPRAQIIALNTKIFISLDQHDFVQAEEDSRRAAELMERIGARRFVPLCNHGIAVARLHRGDRQGALELLETSLTVAQETGMNFWGPIVCSVIAMASGDPKRRQDALRQGQDLLDRGCVSHNYFWFYRDAIEVSLAMNDWDQADRYAGALEEYFRVEPMSWPSFIVARGRALAEFGRGTLGEATVSRIKHLRDQATRLNMHSELTRLEAALESRTT